MRRTIDVTQVVWRCGLSSLPATTTSATTHTESCLEVGRFNDLFVQYLTGL